MKTLHCDLDLANLTIINNKFFQYFRQINYKTLEILQQKSKIMTKIQQNFYIMLRD